MKILFTVCAMAVFYSMYLDTEHKNIPQYSVYAKQAIEIVKEIVLQLT